MPEYLSPGVFIEEVPARLKAIEGVSTSTAGFVGQAPRGTVAGFALPYVAPAGFELPADPSPVLVTSFAEYMRRFGPPPDDPSRHGYLAHSVRAFFDNGGKRCFIVRAVDTTATRAFLTIGQGPVLRLARRAREGDTTIFLDSLRGLDDAATAQIEFRRVSDGSSVTGGAESITGWNTLQSSVTLSTALGVGIVLEPDRVFVEIIGGATTTTGPRFHARNPGVWGGQLRVNVRNADRPPIAVASPVASASTEIPVRSVTSFYRGAVVAVDHHTPTDRSVHEVTDILTGSRLEVTPALASAVGASGSVSVLEVDVLVSDEGTGDTEVHSRLSWNPDADPDIRRRHYSSVINTRSRSVYVQPPGVAGLAGSEAADLASQPMTVDGFPAAPIAANGGNDGGAIGDAEVVGTDLGPGQRTGIQSLQDNEDIRIIAAPGFTSATIQNELITQCERMRYRFAVLDGEQDPVGSVVNSVLAHRNACDSSFAAYYTPWVEVTQDDRVTRLPSSGYVTGIYARTDNERGVHKAPANEVIRGITGLRSYITTGEQDILNPRGVNAIRRFEGRGIRVWGARTLSSDPEFRYVNVRRFLIFLEASIDRGTQYVVFEPNEPRTWSRVVDSISAFLHTQWREGALFGRRPEDSFFVRCDESTMTADDVQNGRLICNIGVAIVRPAEFVIFRIEQITGFAASS